ncbi:atypical CYS HIS rich thioredoxin 4 [Perilla frutescens var. hirtella]|nr:atypical CYS HIS rich thioredoxin 4 [Perilla frutescens var. frutescens]KAH6801171.1 atypical CYS HIS rich thioredoxin 4 [Perilla frutescens var. hirtella]
MSCLPAGFSVSGSSSLIVNNREKGSVRVCSSIGGLQFRESNSKEIWGKTLDFSDQKGFSSLSNKPLNLEPVYAQGTLSFPKAQKKWWEKSLQPNMIEINSAQELVEYLMNAGDKLVIVDFFSPGCGGCKALHPKICQLAESNPNAIFLTVNYEDHKAMCYALHVHVLPFFRFYRGADGKVCSFSCTNATIKKFKDALAKHGTERCSLAPAKGLDEKELLALVSNDLISRDIVPLSSPQEEKVQELVGTAKSSTFSRDESKIELKEGNAMVAA